MLINTPPPNILLLRICNHALLNILLLLDALIDRDDLHSVTDKTFQDFTISSLKFCKCLKNGARNYCCDFVFFAGKNVVSWS